MERTTWQDIKDRVEIKVSDDIDIDSFITLANEALADLHEVAFLEAAPIFYKGDAIKRTNDYFETTLDKVMVSQNEYDAITIQNLGLVPGRKYYRLQVPFEFSTVANSLKVEWEYKNTLEMILPKVKFNKANYVIMDLTNITSTTDAASVTIKFSNKIMRANGRNGFYETIIKLPSDFSTMIKLEAYDEANDVNVVEGSSINSMDFNNWSRTNSFGKFVYFIQDDKVHIISWNQAVEFVLYYTKRLEKLDVSIQLNEWPIEFENNFENLLTYSIAHKYNENYVGSEDTETTALFNKYMTLKNEYEQKNMPKKNKRVQTEIIVKW